jgi:hypothetical protein
LKALNDVQYNTHPLYLRRTCTEGTRTKILDDLMGWARESSGPNIYWLCGMAGTGKTTIAYSFCEHLKAEDLLGASFFCSRTIDQYHDIRDVFPAIARQLASCSADIRSCLVKAVKEDLEIVSRQPNDQFKYLIHERIHPHLNKPRVIAFDAFDEFKTIHHACHLARILIAFAPNLPNIKVFITSRQEPELHNVLKVVKDTTTLRLHEVEESLVKSDIMQYLVERSDDIRARKELPQTWMTGEELRILQDRAGKLFIYASTVCSFLENSVPEECEENLKVLLSNKHEIPMLSQYGQLDNLYSQVLDAVQLDRHRKSITNSVLYVVVTALNPLSMQTIAALLNEDHVAVYAALRRLGAVIAVPNEPDSDTPVLPFHASFPDFLHDQARSGTHYISEINAHRHMLWWCLTVLDSSPVFKQDICNISNAGIHVSTISPSPLETIPKDVAYSCIYWLVHLQQILDSGPLDEREDSQVMAIFDRHILHWIECMSLLEKLEDAVQLLRQIKLSPNVSYSESNYYLC